MEKKKLPDEVLLNFLDGNISPEEKNFINESIQENNENRIRLNELESVHSHLKTESVLLSPSKNFTDRVMSGLHEKSSSVFLSPKNGFLLIVGLLIASVIALSLISSGAFNQQTNFNFNQIPINIDKIKIPTNFIFDLKGFVKGFVIINLILAFVLLDRTILRPIFQKRSSHMIF